MLRESYTRPLHNPADGCDTAAENKLSRFRLNRLFVQSAISHSTMEMLRDEGYGHGLISSLLFSKQTFPLRIWIVDNSGSMSTSDWNLIAMERKRKLIAGCSRWAEMQQTINYHARIAAAVKITTIFRLLNDPGIYVGPQQFSIGENSPDEIEHELDIVQQIMEKTSPRGVTPLVQHMSDMRSNILELEPQLLSDNAKVVIIIATDGVPSDSHGNSTDAIKHEFVQILQSMERLPIAIIVRLFTHEENVVKYWKTVDKDLELKIEVLDDFSTEATKINTYNRWLNYGLPLHRIREMGFHNDMLGLVAEKKLTKHEIRQFCINLFGHGLLDDAPDPESDWKGFRKVVKVAMTEEKEQWNPRSKVIEPWINMKVLKKACKRRRGIRKKMGWIFGGKARHR